MIFEFYKDFPSSWGSEMVDFICNSLESSYFCNPRVGRNEAMSRDAEIIFSKVLLWMISDLMRSVLVLRFKYSKFSQRNPV